MGWRARSLPWVSWTPYIALSLATRSSVTSRTRGTCGYDVVLARPRLVCVHYHVSHACALFVCIPTQDIFNFADRGDAAAPLRSVARVTGALVRALDAAGVGGDDGGMRIPTGGDGEMHSRVGGGEELAGTGDAGARLAAARAEEEAAAARDAARHAELVRAMQRRPEGHGGGGCGGAEATADGGAAGAAAAPQCD